MSDALTKLEEKLELLKEAHTQEDLDRVKAEVEEARLKALSESVEYRQLLEERQLETNVRAEKIRREYNEKMSEAKLKANAAIDKAEGARAQTERMRAYLMPGKLNMIHKLDTGYECLRCKETSLNWMVSGKGKHKKKTPWCFRCNMKMHRKGDKQETTIRLLRHDEAMNEVLKKIKGQLEA